MKLNVYDEIEFPEAIMIEVSNYCNQSCIFCSNKFSKRKKEFVDDEVARGVIKYARELGAKEISFHGMGEPFTNPNLIDYIRLANDVSYDYIYIDTNGALATPEKLDEAIDAGLDSIKFSIAASNAETYKQIQGKDDFDTVISNLYYLIDQKKQGKNIKVIIDFCLTRFNEGQDEILRKRFENGIDEFWISPCGDQAGEIDNSDITLGNYETMKCIEPFYRLVVTANNYADACCMDNDNKLVYANLKDVMKRSGNRNYLLDVWASGKRIRDSHRMGGHVPEKCRRCSFIKCYEIMDGKE